MKKEITAASSCELCSGRARIGRVGRRPWATLKGRAIMFGIGIIELIVVGVLLGIVVAIVAFAGSKKR